MEAGQEAAQSREWQWGWGISFLANIPVSLLFGLHVTEQGGTLGMLVGLVVVWLTGHFVVARVRRVRRALVLGGLWLVPTQGLPVVQICAGLNAIYLVPGGGRTAADGFALTILTAGQLVSAALLLGFLLGGTGYSRSVERRINEGE